MLKHIIYILLLCFIRIINARHTLHHPEMNNMIFFIVFNSHINHDDNCPVILDLPQTLNLVNINVHLL